MKDITTISYHYATLLDLVGDLERQADNYEQVASSTNQPRYKSAHWKGYVEGLRSAANQIRESNIIKGREET